MADIELVIKIPEEHFKKICANKEDSIIAHDTCRRIANGTPLPKGHGRLIDSNELRCENADFDTYNDYCLMFDEIDNAPTIIEADKAESEE